MAKGHGHTKGKGPFASKRRPEKIHHWIPPPIDLDEHGMQTLLEFIEKKNDVGVMKLFRSLAHMEPGVRLARNLSELLRCLVRDQVTDVLVGGLSDMEDSALGQLQQWGVSPELLGVAHALLNVRERQDSLAQLGDAFFVARYKKTYLKGGTKE